MKTLKATRRKITANFWRSAIARKAARRWVDWRNDRLLKEIRGRKEVGLKVVAPPGEGGSIEHFYHFLFDLVLPLYHLQQVVGQSVVFKLKRQGPFIETLDSLFGSTVQWVDDEGSQEQLTLVGMNPKAVAFKAGELDSFREWVTERLVEGPKETLGRVVFIRRGKTDSYFQSEACQIKGGGEGRRSLKNSDEVSLFLGSAVAANIAFQEVCLEDLDFTEQVLLFSETALVVAQHGAGLANCLWMKKGARVFEIGDAKEKPHFKILANICELSHLEYCTQEDHCFVDTERMKMLLTSQPDYARFFEGFTGR